jgi:hypothetical protein
MAESPHNAGATFTVGTGLVFGGVFLEAQYHILPFNRNTRYVSVNIGTTGKSPKYPEKNK